MSAILTFKKLTATLLLTLLLTTTAHAQHQWQEPIERSMAEVGRILGPIQHADLSRDLNIVWVWGVDYDHERGFHEYDWVMNLFVNKIFAEAPNIHVTPRMYFPTDEEWAKADLVIFYHHAFKLWGDDEAEQIEAFQKRGGGTIYLHESVIQRPGEPLAEHCGLAWGTPEAPNGQAGWGLFPRPMTITEAGQKHPIFEGFGDTFDLVDEFYWNLTGDVSKITPLVTSPAGKGGHSDGPPKKRDLDGKAWPAIWTMEEGKARTFTCVPGHNYFTFNDPYFRIMLFRAIAWTTHEDFDSFKYLVLKHLGNPED